MNSFFYYLDIFKAPVNFNVCGKPNFSTKFGCLATLPIIIFLSFSFFRSDMILKEYPTISSQQIVGTSRPYLKFDKSNMTFAVRVADENGVGFLDETFFTIEMHNVVVNNTSNEVISFDKKKTKICDETDFTNPNYLKDYGLKNSICSENDTFNIGGYWTEPFISYMRILLFPCKNETDSKVVCKSPDEIKNYFKNKYFGPFYNDYSFDLNNYEKPIQSHYDMLYQMTDASIRKSITMYYKKVDYINDDGFFFMNNEVENYFNFEKIETDFSLDALDYISEIVVYSSKNVQLMTRRYQKIQEVCANLGGIGSVLIFFGLLIVLFEKDFNLRKSVLNQLYCFPTKKNYSNQEINSKKNIEGSKNEFQMNASISENAKTNNIKENVKDSVFTNKDAKLNNFEFENERKNFIFPKILIDDIPLSLKSFENAENVISRKNEATLEKDLVLNDSNMKISVVSEKKKFTKRKSSVKNVNREVFNKFKNFTEFQRNESKKQKLNISFKEYLKYEMSGLFKCLKRNQNQILFHKASKLILEETDFFNVLKRIQEIDKLKLILLNSEQLQLFNLLSKPMIFDEDLLSNDQKEFDGFKMSIMLQNNQLGKQENINSILDYYKKIKEKKGNEVDDRLIKLVDGSFEQYVNFHRKK